MNMAPAVDDLHALLSPYYDAATVDAVVARHDADMLQREAERVRENTATSLARITATYSPDYRRGWAFARTRLADQLAQNAAALAAKAMDKVRPELEVRSFAAVADQIAA